jgi:hypothetical protein
MTMTTFLQLLFRPGSARESTIFATGVFTGMMIAFYFCG